MCPGFECMVVRGTYRREYVNMRYQYGASSLLSDILFAFVCFLSHFSAGRSEHCEGYRNGMRMCTYLLCRFEDDSYGHRVRLCRKYSLVWERNFRSARILACQSQRLWYGLATASRADCEVPHCPIPAWPGSRGVLRRAQELPRSSYVPRHLSK